VIPKGQMHRYRFVVDGRYENDSINPQVQRLDNGQLWSRFFTDSFTQPLVLERWELEILARLTTEMMPFQTSDAANFLQRFYNYLDRGQKEAKFGNVYRLDDSVGEINFVDNILAREERHRLTDYKLCLSIMDRVLRMRNPAVEPAKMSTEIYRALYNEM